MLATSPLRLSLEAANTLFGATKKEGFKKNIKNNFKVTFLMCVAIYFASCNEEKDKSQKVTAPDVRPPVEESLPAALLSGRTSTTMALNALTS